MCSPLAEVLPASNMTSRSKEIPASNKSNHLVDHHGDKVKELMQWLRIVKTTGVVLIISILINWVLMYGLIRYPCKPSATECQAYCTAKHVPRMVVEHPLEMQR